jgi:putative ABC transport system permease protein
VTDQVWVAAGARRLIEARLAAAHVRVLSAQDADAMAAQLGRQGPGLASVLFLADAAAAAVLAVGGAILGLYLSAGGGGTSTPRSPPPAWPAGRSAARC